MSQPLPYIRQEDQRLVLIDTLKEYGYQGIIAVTVQQYDVDDQMMQKQLIKHGADIVFLPYRDAAKNAVEQLEKQISKRRI